MASESEGKTTMRTLRGCVTAVLCAVLVGASLFAADWPEWRGAGRVGVWTEDGIIERFPADGLKVVWRTGPSGAARDAWGCGPRTASSSGFRPTV